MKPNISITVSNFGPIKSESTIKLGQMVIFSGDSGLGKSYLAMLVHFVYKVISGYELRKFLLDNGYDYDILKKDIGDDESVICKISSLKMSEWIDHQALVFLRNMIGNQQFNANIHIDMPSMLEYFTFLYSRKPVMGKDNDEMTYVESLKLKDMPYAIQLPQDSGNWESIPFVILINNYLRQLYEITPNRTFIMPPSRGSLVAIPDNMLYSLQDSMGMYIEFLNNLSALKALKPSDDSVEVKAEAINMLHTDVLHGDIELKDKDVIYKLDSNEILPITAAASSVKELVPFALIIQKKLLSTYSILFEEPESHLHPDMQMKVADLLGYAIKDGAHLQITTHSDYFLRRINDLIRLHILRDQFDDSEKFNTFCSENGFRSDCCIDSSCVKAYIFENNQDGDVSVREQNVSQGIPFDTFSHVIDNQIVNSAKLYDMIN